MARIISFKEYNDKINDFFTFSTSNVKKGKDIAGNYIYLSPKEKFIMYPPKYKNIYKYKEDLEKERKNIEFKLENLRNSLLSSKSNFDDINYKKKTNELYSKLIQNKKEFDNIHNFIMEQKMITDKKISQINFDINNNTQECSELFRKKEYIFDLNKENWNEINSSYLEKYKLNIDLASQLKNLKDVSLFSEMLIEEPKIEYIKTYDKNIYLKL